MLFAIFQILAIFWLIRTIRIISFYLYLWQLKEYHMGRFLAHFRTEKGKHLILNKLTALKFAFLVYFFLFPYFFLSSIRLDLPSFIPLALYYLFPFLLLIFYFFESAKFLFNLFEKKLKLPVLTKKVVILFLAITILGIGAIFPLLRLEKELNLFAFWLLIADLSAPLIISAIILILQPFTVLLKMQIIIRAKRKREGFKNLLVIGITGSYGKTSTKEFLYTILSQKFNVLKIEISEPRINIA